MAYSVSSSTKWADWAMQCDFCWFPRSLSTGIDRSIVASLYIYARRTHTDAISKDTVVARAH